MKKLLLVLFLIAAAAYGFTERGVVLNKELVLNKNVTIASTTDLWESIRILDVILPYKETISINFNSNGGDSQAIVVLIQRIKKLQESGRKFKGTIYGYCYSSCGSIFASMDRRYMTENAIYMQHKSYVRIVPTQTDLVITHGIDKYRLKSDALMMNKSVDNLINIFRKTDFVANAIDMLRYRYIDGIVPQPNI